MTLITNRYNQVTPTSIYSNGCSVSCPIYFRPTADQAKELLNAFRELVKKQRIEMGFEHTEVSPSGMVVATAKTPPQTPAELELGMNEDTLRYAIFQRQGIPERLFLQLSFMVGVELIPRAQIEETYKEWLDHLYEKQRTKEPDTPRKRTTKRATSSSAPSKRNKG